MLRGRVGQGWEEHVSGGFDGAFCTIKKHWPLITWTGARAATTWLSGASQGRQ